LSFVGFWFGIWFLWVFGFGFGFGAWFLLGPDPNPKTQIKQVPNPNPNPKTQRNQVPNQNPKTQKYLDFKNNPKKYIQYLNIN